MKVLFVCPTVPWPPDAGGRTRTSNLVREASKHCEVHLRCVLDPGCDESALEPFARHVASARGFPRGPAGVVKSLTRPKLERWFHSPRLEAELARELATGAFDVVHLDEMFLARVLPPGDRTPVVVHHHKLDVELAAAVADFDPRARRDPRARLDLEKLRRLERAAAERSRYHVTCGASEARRLEARYPGLSAAAVPSGVDAERFAPPDPAPARDAERVLFLGTMSYPPNVDAAVWMVREILPRLRERRPNAQLEILGRDPAPQVRALQDAPGVHVRGGVDDVRAALSLAGVLAVPLRIGGGTRLKIVEALAMECPVVSTRVGAEDLPLEDPEHLLLRDAADEFAEALSTTLADAEAAHARAAAGRLRVLDQLTWSRLAERLVQSWREAAAAPTTRPRVR